MIVESADLIKYNANTRGSNVGDCTTRAISLAFNMDYAKVRKIQNESSKVNHIYPFNNLKNCEKVIKQLGGGNLITDNTCTVEEFVDSHSGTYILYCGKYEDSTRSTHLVCMINDRVYDSWDSRKRHLKGFWKIENGLKQEDLTDIQVELKQMLITDRSFDYYHQYVSNIFNKIIDKNRKIKKIQANWDHDLTLNFSIDRIRLKDYTFILTCNVDVIFGGSIKPKKYPGKIVVTFKPTMKIEDVDEHFNITFYNKFYSYLYDIINKIEDTCEGAKLLGDQAINEKEIDFWDKGEQRSFNALPYWARALATHFRIDINRYWGDECREIILRMKMPKFDSNYSEEGNNQAVRFEATDMDALRKGLDYYKQTGDFDHAYEIAARL